MNYAFIFPGQGSQFVGMGKELCESSKQAAEIFAKADSALGRPLSKLIFEGPQSDLTLTWNTQPAILTMSIACFSALKARYDLSPVAFAGHSLGEYSALVASGALDFSDAVRIVEKRGKYMQEAVPVGEGTMYAILGLDADKLDELCAKVSKPGHSVQTANDNCPGQVVVSGHVAAVKELAQLATEAGAKRAIELSVSAPFHSALMAPAADRLKVELDALKYSAPSAPVVANVDGKPNSDPARIAGLLYRQITGAVLWQDCVKSLAALGAQKLVEVGPGKVLSGMTKRIEKSLESSNVEDSAGIEKFGNPQG